jgi:electron transfer flavoprotein alpha subunit
MAHNILVWIETFKGKAVPVSYECLGEAKKLANGGKVTAAVFGENATAIANEAISVGADQAIVCEDVTFAEYRAEPYIALLAKVAIDLKPDVIMAGASTRGRDVSSGLAVELEAGAIADCTAIEEQGDQLIATRRVYAGKLLSHVVVKTTPVIITTRSRAFRMPETVAQDWRGDYYRACFERRSDRHQSDRLCSGRRRRSQP